MSYNEDNRKRKDSNERVDEMDVNAQRQEGTGMEMSEL
jgi:hypothetical protein